MGKREELAFAAPSIGAIRNIYVKCVLLQVSVHKGIELLLWSLLWVCEQLLAGYMSVTGSHWT